MAAQASAFLVWGAGGHGRVVADLVRSLGHRVAGFVDADPANLARTLEASVGLTLHEQEFLSGIRERRRFPAGAGAIALGVGHNVARQSCLRSLSEFAAPPLVHPSAVVSPSVAVGRATTILPGAIVNANARIEEAVIVNSGAIVEHDCQISEAVHISPGATLAGGVVVGERSWIGAGATVIQGISIGADAIVGAGAVVIRDVPDGTTVVGVPAKAIHRRY